MTAPTDPDNELCQLTTTPCTRCFQCDFKPDIDCQNKYEECSICAVIRALAIDFNANTTHKATRMRLSDLREVQNVITDGNNDYRVGDLISFLYTEIAELEQKLKESTTQKEVSDGE